MGTPSMWSPIPPVLAIASACVLAWYVAALVLLSRLPLVVEEDGRSVAPAAWRAFVFGPLGAGAVLVVALSLRDGDPFRAWGVAFVAGLLCLAAIGARAAVGVPSFQGPTLPWLLAFAALLLRLAAPEVAPPGVAEDEARTCIDCLGVLAGQTGILTIGWVNHPNFPCLFVSPLLALLGPGAAAPHLYTAVAGALSVAAFFVVARMFLSPAAALFSTVLLLVSPYHLFYSRVLYGSDIVLSQLLFLAFAVDAARRLAWSSALMAGIALGVLYYQYMIVRILPLALLMIFAAAQWRDRGRWVRRATVLLVVVAGFWLALSPLLLRPDGRLFLFNPVHLRLLGFHAGMEPSEAWQHLVTTVRGHLLLLHRQGPYGAHAHSRTTILPLWAEALLAFGFTDAVLRSWRFRPVVLAGLFVIGLLPSIVSESGNGHRILLALPAVYLLIGSAAERLGGLAVRGRRSGRAFAAVLLAVAVAGSIQSVVYYFRSAWLDPNDLAQFGDYSAGIGREAQRLSSRGATFVSSLRVEPRYLNDEPIRTGLLRPLTFAEWLPENWDTRSHALVFDPYRIALTEALYAVLPAGEIRAIVNPIGRRTGGVVALSPGDLHALKIPAPGADRCGSVFFRMPRRVVRVREGKIEVDGVQLGPDAGPWLAAGLHGACVDAPAVLELEAADGSKETVRLAAPDLYRLGVHGWLRRTVCPEDPNTVRYLAVEPFLYWISDYAPTTPACATGRAVDSYVATVKARTDPLHLAVESRSGRGIDVLVDGRSVVREHSGPAPADFVVPGSAAPRTIEVRTTFPSDLTLSVREGGAWRVPPYEAFDPAGQASVAPARAGWGRFDRTFPRGELVH